MAKKENGQQIKDLDEKEILGVKNKQENKQEEKKSPALWIEELFADNEYFFKKAVGSYRKDPQQRALKSFKKLQEIVINLSGEEEISLEKFKKKVNSALGKLKSIDNFTVSEGFKNSVREVFFNVGAKKEKDDGEVKELSAKDIDGERSKIENAQLQEARKFAKEGRVLYTNKGTIIVEKYIVSEDGVRVVFYDDKGNKQDKSFKKFSNEYTINGRHKNYKNKIKADINHIIFWYRKGLSSIEDIAKKEIRDRYKERLDEVVKGLENIKKEEITPDVFYKVKVKRKDIDFIVRDIDVIAERNRKAKRKRKEGFFGVYGEKGEKYILKREIDGKEVVSEEFTLLNYLVKNNEEDDKVLISINGERKKITVSEFKELVNKKGFVRRLYVEGKPKKIKAVKKGEGSVKKMKTEDGSANNIIDEESNPSKEVGMEGKNKKEKEKEIISPGGADGRDAKRSIQKERKPVANKDDAEITERRNIKAVDNELEKKLNSIIENNPEVKDIITGKMSVSKNLQEAYNKAKLKDRVLMLLGEQSNQARKKYLEKDYQMDRRLGGIRRFFGKTFKMDGFEKELEFYKKDYEKARENYKKAILELEAVKDREDAEILAYEFQVYEQLRWRNDRLDIAMENNPEYEVFKKFILGAVDRYRKMRKWPGDKISELFGFKGLTKGVGIVSGMLITGKMLKEFGMIGNPAFKVFSVAVSAVGYKQFLEVMAEKKRMSQDEKEIKKVLRSYGATFESGKNIDELDRWLTQKNEELSERIQNEKYWRNWRTIMAGGMALGTFVGADLLSKYFKGDNYHIQQQDHQLGNVQNETHGSVNDEKIKKLMDNYYRKDEIIPNHNHGGDYEHIENTSNKDDILEPRPLGDENLSDTHSVEHNVQENVKVVNSADVKENIQTNDRTEAISGKEIKKEILNPNLIAHRNITGSELKIAYGLGFTPAQYARLNDVPVANITDIRIKRLWGMFGEKALDPSKITLGEFFRQIDFDKLPKNMSLAEMSGEDYIDYLASVINYEARDLKSELAGFNVHKWNEMKNHLATSELNENFREFYSEMSKKFSLFAKPGENVDKWLLRLTKFAYDRGLLDEVKKDLNDIVSKK